MVDRTQLNRTLIDDDDLTPPIPDISHIETEDDTPVDNLFSEKEMRLLADILVNGWRGPADGRPFVVMANVGVFSGLRLPALTPDLLLSLGVTYPADIGAKEHRAYFVWEYGKPPDVVVEIVSNQKGDELSDKLLDYARIGVSYYVVHDPYHHLGKETLRVFERKGSSLRELSEFWLEEVGLGLVLWQGEYEGVANLWLRWCTRDGVLIPTGREATLSAAAVAAAEQARAAQAEQRAAQAEQLAEAERQRAEALAARLRALGIDPDAA